MSKRKYLIDMFRAHEIDYLLQDEICRYLLKIRFEVEDIPPENQATNIWYTTDPEEIYQTFKNILIKLSADKHLLRNFVQNIIRKKC